MFVLAVSKNAISEKKNDYGIYFLQLEQQIIARVITSSMVWNRPQTKLERTKEGEPCF